MIVSTEVAHSEIMTAKVTFWNVAEAEGEPEEAVLGEECVLPPVSVADLRHQTLAVAIFCNFEMMFGKRLAEFVNTLNFCGLVVLVCACDYAGTSAIVVSWIRRLLEIAKSLCGSIMRGAASISWRASSKTSPRSTRCRDRCGLLANR